MRALALSALLSLAACESPDPEGRMDEFAERTGSTPPSDGDAGGAADAADDAGTGGVDAIVDDAGNVCCMHVDEVLVNNYTMAKYMKAQKGYTSGMFGTYLNNCPDTAQPGWDAWFANGGGNCKCSSSLCVFFLSEASKKLCAD